MESWYFTEMPYPHLPPIETLDNMRVAIPNRLYDPRIGADLYHRYLDEYLEADDVGLNMMVNEHHQTATCLDTCTVMAFSSRRRAARYLGNHLSANSDLRAATGVMRPLRRLLGGGADTETFSGAATGTANPPRPLDVGY